MELHGMELHGMGLHAHEGLRVQLERRGHMVQNAQQVLDGLLVRDEQLALEHAFQRWLVFPLCMVLVDRLFTKRFYTDI